MESSVEITGLPPELLEHILGFLPAVELVRSRRVCRRWRALVDVLTGRDEYWQKMCTIDHSTTYEQARAKCLSELTWRQLYQSLHLWTKLEAVRNTNWIKIHTKQSRGGEILNISAFKGQALIHMEDKVLFYDMENNVTDVFNTVGINMGYEETSNVIVYSLTMILSSGLCIIKKVNGKPDFENMVFVYNALNFAVIGDDVYYDKYDATDEYRHRYETLVHVFVNRAEDNYKTSVKLQTFDERIISFGRCNNAMTILTETMAIYVLEDNKFDCKEFLDDNKRIEMLKKYNFELCREMMAELTEEIGFHIASYCSYGELMFLGDDKGVIKVYNSEKLISDPLRCKPIVKYNLATTLRLNKRNTNNPVCSIDVIEKLCGHYLLAAVREGAVAIELSHIPKEKSVEDGFIYTRTRSRMQNGNVNSKIMGSKIKKSKRRYNLRKRKF